MRSIILLLLAILFLGALANTVQRRHYTRRQGKGSGGPPPHHGGNHAGGHGGNNAPGHEGNNQPHEGGNHQPHESANDDPEDDNDNDKNNNDRDDKNEEGPLEGPPSLEEIVDQVCNNVTRDCEKDGVVSNHDGQVSDLCDNGFCKEFLPKNLCFFECISKCEQAENKDDCANQCMKCGAQGPPPIPLDAIPGLCKELANGCKAENQTSRKDGTVHDLCEIKYCNEFLPKHQCFLPCAMKCLSSNLNHTEGEICSNQCMVCKDPAGDHKDGNGNEAGSHHEGGAEGEGEVEGAGEEEGEGEVEDKGEVNHNVGEVKEEGVEAESARRIVHLMKRNRQAKPFTKLLAEAQGRSAYRRYSRSVQRRRRASVRRHAVVRRRHSNSVRGRYYQSRSDSFW